MLTLIFIAGILDKRLLFRLRLIPKWLYSTLMILCLLVTVVLNNRSLPPDRQDYVQTFHISKMPVIQYLKKNHSKDLLVCETLRAYWIGAQLPNYVYAYMIGRLRTYYEDAQNREDINEKIWRHEGQPEEIAGMVRKLSPAIVLLSIYDKSYKDFIDNKEFKLLYEESQWAIFSPI